MKQAAFKLAEHLQLRKVEYTLSSILWDKWDIDDIDLRFDNWIKIKYLNDNIDDFNEDINLVPNNTGGLYLFYIKCKTISGITEFPLYIGRAQFSENQNLRKRVRTYFRSFIRGDERPKIDTMFNYWGSQLHLAFIEIDTNIEIIDLEKKIINSLLLPMNDEIADKEIRQAVKAF